MKSFETLLRRMARVLPQPTLTWKVKNIHTGRIITGTGQSFPQKIYGNRNNYEVCEIWTRLKVRDVIRLHAALHNGDCDFMEGDKIDYSKVHLTMTVDGIPHGKSSPENLHVMAIRIRGCRHVYILQARVAHRRETKNVVDFAGPFVDECNELGVVVDYFVADSPMRAFFKILKGHAGRCSCEICEAAGECINRKIVYPASQVHQRKRTHDRWLDDVADVESQVEGGNANVNVRGIMGRSPLLALNNLDIVKQCPPDPLHRDWLGITKSTLWRHTMGMAKSGIMNARGQRMAEQISDSYKNLRLPEEFSHTARPIDYPNFKGHEWKALLISSFPTICEVVQNEMGHKAAHLWAVFAYLILLYGGPEDTFQSTPKEDLEELHELLYDEFQEEFGPAACSFNWHSFYHMPTVRTWATMKEVSTEPFEAAYGLVQMSYAPGTRNTGLQIVRNMLMRSLAHTKDFCKNELFIEKDTGSTTRDNSIVFDDQFNYYQVQRVTRHGTVEACEIGKKEWKCPTDPTLPFSHVGVFQFDSIKDERRIFSKKKFTGKGLLRNDGILIPFHEQLLFS